MKLSRSLLGSNAAMYYYMYMLCFSSLIIAIATIEESDQKDKPGLHPENWIRGG